MIETLKHHVGGRLVEGTSGSEVLLGSLEAVPGRGDWGGIALNAGSTGTTIEHATIEHAVEAIPHHCSDHPKRRRHREHKRRSTDFPRREREPRAGRPLSRCYVVRHRMTRSELLPYYQQRAAHGQRDVARSSRFSSDKRRQQRIDRR